MALKVYSKGDWIVFNGSDWQHIDIENEGPIPLEDIQVSLGGSEVVFKGTWKPSTNTPYLSLERNLIGDFYVVNAAGSIDFTDLDPITRPNTWMEGDWVFHDGVNWIKLENQNPIDLNIITSDILFASDISSSDFSGLTFKGLWDASSNSPVITNSTGTLGEFYVVSVEGNYQIVDSISPPTPALPDVPEPSDNTGQAVFVGSLTLSNLLPGFSDSVDQLQGMIDEFAVPFVNNKKSILDSADRKVESFQNLLSDTVGAAQQARGLLDNAQSLLDEALNVANSLTTALDTAGIYAYYYLGPVGNFGDKLDASMLQGEGAAFTDGNAPVAAFITIAGADGGIVESSLRVKNLFNILGGNGQSVADAFKKLVE